MSAPSPIARYLGVARQFVRIGVIRKSQFRLEFFTQVVMDIIWYATHLLTFEILFLHTEAIAGWELAEVRVFLGFVYVADAFLMACLGQAWHFGRELKDGKLDPVRIRPIAPVFLYFFQRFSLEGTVNMAIAVGYLLYAVVSATDPGPVTWVMLLWGVAIAWWGRLILTVLLSIAEFYLLHSNLANFGHEVFAAGSDNPLDVFGRRTRAFLLHVVPLGALAHIPASMVLGRYGWAEAAGHSLWLFLLGCGILRLWSRGFRRYESALS